MADRMCTVRVVNGIFERETDKSYMLKFSEGMVFLPKSITSKKVNENHGSIDFDCPLWVAKKNYLDDYIVSEY